MKVMKFKYAVETAICGSVNGAAKKMSIAQSNISRAISDLEKEYGIQIFERTPNGIVPTREGQHFLQHAKCVVDEVEYLNEYVKECDGESTDLKIAIPKESYASCAFADFVQRMESVQYMKLHIRECSTMEALDCILKSDYNMAMLRFEKEDEDYFQSIMQVRGIVMENIIEYQLRILTNQDGPIAKSEIRGYEDLEGYIEIRQGDARRMNGAYVDTLDTPENRNSAKRIHIYERGSQLALLRQVPKTFMWETPSPKRVLELHGLVEIPCPWQKKWMKDVLLYPKKHTLRQDERIFMEALKKEAAALLEEK